jgi:tetratricopeptide (TPR) repeat protein
VPGIGARLRQARLKAGLTQQKLAGDRYTKAYVSALENGLVNPSMVALEYLASRLGTSASQLIADDRVGWSRLEADLLLASGQWQAAVDAYSAILSGAVDPISRADILRGAAEAMTRLDRGEEAVTMATEAVGLYEALGREADAALASYWLAAAVHHQDNVDDARAVLHALLAKVRAGLRVEPEFELRLLMALSTTEAREGSHEAALSYDEEIRGRADSLDDRQRATYLFDLSLSHRERGDYEAALRTGYASLALFDAARVEVDMASLQNEVALSHLATGSAVRAEELAASARSTFERLGDQRLLAHVFGTQAQIRAEGGEFEAALELARQSLELAELTGNQVAAVNALLTTARVQASLGHEAEAHGAFEKAVELARRLSRPSVMRRALTEWADHLAGAGDHRAAFELTREALGA